MFLALWRPARHAVDPRRRGKGGEPDYVFHLAAQSFPRTSFDAPLDTMDTNIQGTVRVLDALRDIAPKAIIHVCASSEVFGRVPKEKLPIDEECSFHPGSPLRDLQGRHRPGRPVLCRGLWHDGMTTRMFTHTGPRRGDVFAESTFAKQIAMIEHNLIPPVVKVGNLQSLRTVADVRDAVRAYYMLVTVNPIAGAYYNIGGTTPARSATSSTRCCRFRRCKADIEVEVDPDRLRPIDADLQVPNTAQVRGPYRLEAGDPLRQDAADLLDYWRTAVARRATVSDALAGCMAFAIKATGALHRSEGKFCHCCGVGALHPNPFRGTP